GDRGEARGAMRTGAAGVRLTQSATTPSGEVISHYTCSMHPSVHEAHPGKCPICGMDLIPVTQGEAKSGVVRVDAERLQKIGVRFAEVARAPLVRTIRALGRVTWDETRLVDVAPKTRGFVRALYAHEISVTA